MEILIVKASEGFKDKKLKNIGYKYG
jgi:hypothetical protein